MKEYHYMNLEYHQLLEWNCQPEVQKTIAMRDHSTKPDFGWWISTFRMSVFPLM